MLKHQQSRVESSERNSAECQRSQRHSLFRRVYHLIHGRRYVKTAMIQTKALVGTTSWMAKNTEVRRWTQWDEGRKWVSFQRAKRTEGKHFRRGNRIKTEKASVHSVWDNKEYTPWKHILNIKYTKQHLNSKGCMEIFSKSQRRWIGFPLHSVSVV